MVGLIHRVFRAAENEGVLLGSFGTDDRKIPQVSS
jgi:hypothetical protein